MAGKHTHASRLPLRIGRRYDFRRVHPIDLEGTGPVGLNNRVAFGSGEMTHLLGHAQKATNIHGLQLSFVVFFAESYQKHPF